MLKARYLLMTCSVVAACSFKVSAAKESVAPSDLLVEGSYIVTFRPSTAAAPSPVMPRLPREQLRTRAPAHRLVDRAREDSVARDCRWRRHRNNPGAAKWRNVW